MEELAAAFVLLVLAGGKGRRRDTPAPDTGERDAFGVAYARGSSAPAWPLPTIAERRITLDFGDARPSKRDEGQEPERHHCGEDLMAPEGTPIHATEDGRVVMVDLDWYKGTGVGALLVANDSGIVVNYGEIGSSSILVAKGARIRKGQQLGRVSRTDQLHFETYRAGTTRTHQWIWQKAPPPALLDPTRYLQRAADGA